jgi:carboxyl-terminal processing protease
MDFNGDKKKSLNGRGFKKAVFSVSILVLMLLSFGAGMYAAKSGEVFAEAAKKETVFLGKLMGAYSTDGGGRLQKDVDFNLYWELWDALREKYVDKDGLNEKKMFYGSLAGLAASLGDPYTTFMNPEEYREFENDMAGTFEGIGAEVGMKDDIITVIAPLSDMPAERAGLKAGDQILAVNGTSTLGLNVSEAVGMIRGPKGTTVKLTIYRKGFKETKEYEIVRDVIYVKSVKSEMRDDGIYVIEVSSFNDDTNNLFSQAVIDVMLKNPKGIILDLRSNPGGYLDGAIDMASEWVSEGPVVKERFSDGSEDSYDAVGLPRLKGYKTVVLVDGGSASASEIVAGALQDYELAKIIGTKTYGKGSVQAMENLSDGSSLKVTVAKWMTPNGRSINDEGISPDEEVKMTEEDYINEKDPQMDRAIEILLGKEASTAKK